MAVQGTSARRKTCAPSWSASYRSFLHMHPTPSGSAANPMAGTTSPTWLWRFCTSTNGSLSTPSTCKASSWVGHMLCLDMCTEQTLKNNMGSADCQLLIFACHYSKVQALCVDCCSSLDSRHVHTCSSSHDCSCCSRFHLRALHCSR